MLSEFLKYYKLFSTLLKPIEGTINTLKIIEAKLDAQATSKLRGQIRSLQRIYETGTPDKTTLSNCLNSLTESCEYFKMMTDQTFKALEKQIKHENLKIFVEGLTFKFFRTGRTTFHNAVQLFTEFMNYWNLVCLSEIGIVVCMDLLKYPFTSINEEYFNYWLHFRFEQMGNIEENTKIEELQEYLFFHSTSIGFIPENFYLRKSADSVISNFSFLGKQFLKIRPPKTKQLIKNWAATFVLLCELDEIIRKHPVKHYLEKKFELDDLIDTIIENKTLLKITYDLNI